MGEEGKKAIPAQRDIPMGEDDTAKELKVV